MAANTKIKRATKFTSFELMFGRKCDAIPLLNLSRKLSTYPSEEPQSSENESIINETLVDPFDIEMEANDDLGSEMEFSRQQNESEARVNIKIEQSTQKRIYDKKVKKNRYIR